MNHLNTFIFNIRTNLHIQIHVRNRIRTHIPNDYDGLDDDH